ASCLRGEVDEREDLVDAAVRNATGSRDPPQMIPAGATGMEAGRLDCSSDTAKRLVELRVPPAPDRGGARRGPHQAEQDAQRRRLPGAVRPQEPGHGSRSNAEAEVVDSDLLAKPLGQPLDLDHGHKYPPRELVSPTGGQISAERRDVDAALA